MSAQYTYLKKGEIIREGDEAETGNGWDEPIHWVRAKCVGQPAPDPKFIAHRTYRRAIKPAPTAEADDG